MADKILLSICEHPPTITYTNTTYPLSIICKNTHNEKWFYSNYVNITSVKDPQSINRVNFFLGDSYGGIEPLIYKKEILSESNSVFDQLYSIFSNGWYVFTFLDFESLGIAPYALHNILLYGIDNDLCIIHALGYVNEHFVPFTISWDVFLTAYNSHNNVKKLLTRCIKPRNKDIGFSYEKFETQLIDYFHSKFSADKVDCYYCNIDKIRTDENELMEDFIVNTRKKGGYNYGFDCYESLEQYLKLNMEPEYIDIRPYRLMWEHKKIMKDRFVYFQEEKIYPFDMSCYIEEMSKIEQLSNILFKLILKARIKKKFSIGHITEMIDRIKIKEYILLEKLISEIEATKCFLIC